MTCQICGIPGTVTVKPLNGHSAGIGMACEACRQTVKDRRRNPGVVVHRGRIVVHVTDGRFHLTAERISA